MLKNWHHDKLRNTFNLSYRWGAVYIMAFHNDLPIASVSFDTFPKGKKILKGKKPLYINKILYTNKDGLSSLFLKIRNIARNKHDVIIGEFLENELEIINVLKKNNFHILKEKELLKNSNLSAIIFEDKVIG